MSEGNFSIYRIIVPVFDIETSVDFYTKLFGDAGRAVGGGRHYFDCGQVILALLENDKSPLPEYIYFAVDDLETVFERARNLNCLSTAEVHGALAGEIVKRPWGELCFYAYDPSGNGLCFVDKNTLFTGLR
ncbi:hypothetical protein BH10ACI1_BH10ACI1_30530 [soil metagenome]